jgi:hypothetical protein
MGCCVSRQIDEELLKEMDKYLESQKISENEKNEIKNEIFKKIQDGPINEEKKDYIDKNKIFIIQEIDHYVEMKYSKDIQQRVFKYIDSVASTGYVTEGDKSLIKEYYFKLTEELIDGDKERIKFFSEVDKVHYAEEMRKYLDKLQFKVTEYIKKHSKDEVARKTGSCINQNTLEYLLNKIKWNFK